MLPRCARPPDTALTLPSPGHRRSIGAFAGLGDGFGCCLLAFFDAICLAAALHAIRTVLEVAVLPSAARESVSLMWSCVEVFSVLTTHQDLCHRVAADVPWQGGVAGAHAGGSGVLSVCE